MSGFQKALARLEAASSPSEGEKNNVVELIDRPGNIPPDVWEVIQDNGRKATMLLNEILHSPKFMRLSANEQAKLIQLAQTRAYGPAAAPGGESAEVMRRKSKVIDATAYALNELLTRADLPEYTKSGPDISRA